MFIEIDEKNFFEDFAGNIKLVILACSYLSRPCFLSF